LLFDNCCDDFEYYCDSPTTQEIETTLVDKLTTADIVYTRADITCENRCGNMTGPCCCHENCGRNKNCCPDYDEFCRETNHVTTHGYIKTTN
jgi:hypothetical protein